MVSAALLPAETDVFVVGGGPAGLAAALAVRLAGFDVIVADQARPPIDKACGEGLMPGGVSALRAIGVDLSRAQALRFRGIRFLDHELEAKACFPSDSFGFGIRRTELHRILLERATQAGVITSWQSRVEGFDNSGIMVDGRTVRCRWIVGADGFHSHVRRWAGIEPAWSGARRAGLRQHFCIRPWSDFVEVYWRDHCQAYVTPVGEKEVCVAIVGRKQEMRFPDLPNLFPTLGKHIGLAEAISAPQGAVSMTVKLSSVTKGNIALVGDASGSVDAVTGDGLTLAFRQSRALAAALRAGDLKQYNAAHGRIGWMARQMARALMLLDGKTALRRWVIGNLAAHPRIFSSLLALHAGEHRSPGNAAWRVA